MSFTLTVPELGLWRNGSTKDLIIELLIREWPLTARAIYSKLQREGNAPLSYQAVHKALLGLEKEKAIEKLGNGYRINPDWASDLRKFSDRIIESYRVKRAAGFGGSKTLDFYNSFDFFRGMLNIFASRVLIEKDAPNFGAGVLRHLWWPLNFNKEEFEKFKIMGEAHDSYVVCSGDTLVDHWLKEYYLKTGFSGIKLGADYKFEDDFVVVGNYYLQVFFPEKMKKTVEELYSSARDMSDVINRGFLESLFRKKTHIRVIIIRNPALCERLRQKIMSYFKGDKK
jgi:hypothetical protein